MATIYGDVKQFESILKSARQIMERYEYTQEEGYEPLDDCDGRDLAPEFYEWAKRIAKEADYYLSFK